jgi:hypothetical protein
MQEEPGTGFNEMFHIMQIFTTVLVAVAMAPAVAHALEYPGKMRLNQDAYQTVQGIYYPGFTIAGGVAEAGGLIATIVLLILTPAGTASFWLTLLALLGMLGMQIVFWIYTQPANRFWLQNAGERVGNAGTRFFAFSPAGHSGTTGAAVDWIRLRDRWEYSHIVRAGLVFLSFVSLLLAIVVHS